MDGKGESDKKEPVNGLASSKIVLNGGTEECDESQSLLPQKGGLSKKKSGKPRRKVQWIDSNGDKLAEVLEFQPSDVSDSEDEDSETCFCRIM